jgi:5-methylcytosine-specific restriction endonuclease McrA
MADTRGRAYQQYINSSRWRNNPARLEELQRSSHRCRLCNLGFPDVILTVHHRTYERLGQELADDLTTLCMECHLAVTDRERRRRHATFPVSPPETRRLVTRHFVASPQEEGYLDLLIAALPGDRRRALDHARSRPR